VCDKLLYTKQEIGPGVVIKKVYNKLSTKAAILIGFFEQKPGIYIVKVRAGVNISANHYIVVNSWTGQIIDPNYSFPISFQWAYINGKLDKEKWETMLKDLEYYCFETMYQMYSKLSRFKRMKTCKFFKKGTCKNGDVCRFVHPTMEVAIMEVAIGATAVKKFFSDLPCDILERIIGVQIR